MDLGPLVLSDEVTAEATGRVVAFEGRTWFEPPLPVAAVLIHPPPPPRPSGLGVPVAGVDLDALSNARSGDGAVEGWATLLGVWSGGLLHVSSQTPPRPEPAGPAWQDPPCPAPAGGWPVTAPDPNLPDLPEALIGSGDIVTVTLFRPSDVQAVMVVAALDPGLVEPALRERYGDSVCVIRSRWSPAHIDAARGQLLQRWEAWAILAVGDTSTEEGQLLIDTRVVQVLPEFAAWAGTVPDGLLRVRPWLAPQR